MPDPSPSRPRVLGGKELAVLALVVLIVVGMMAPIIWRTYQTSLAVRCRGHLAEIYEAGRHYAQNHGGCPPCHGAAPGAESAAERVFSVPWFKHCRPEVIDQHVAAYRKVAEHAGELLKEEA